MLEKGKIATLDSLQEGGNEMKKVREAGLAGLQAFTNQLGTH